jgi:hypothetical protein
VKRLAMLFGLGLLGMLALAPAANAERVECTGAMSGVISANLVVPTSCDLVGAEVRGNVLVEDDAHLGAVATDIRGNLTGQQGSSISYGPGAIGGNLRCAPRCSSVVMSLLSIDGGVHLEVLGDDLIVESNSIRGNLEVLNSAVTGPFVDIRINRNAVDGGVKVSNSSGFHISVTGNEIRQSLLLFDNSPNVFMNVGNDQVGQSLFLYRTVGTSLLTTNVIDHVLACRDNDPPPDSLGNVAERTEGQCAA